MESLDKAAIGQRIKSLRKSRGLRQWQMAQFLGATQPAIHKYENGILPEVKRLVELARIGGTSVEWILTGMHWENGSPEMPRMDREVFELARQVHAYTPEQRRAVEAALEVLHAASGHLSAQQKTGETRELGDAEIGRLVRSFQAHALEPLMTALGIYEAIVAAMARSRVRDMKSFTRPAAEDGPDEDDASSDPAALRTSAG
ncbi:MAG TPA: helix-turn-helix transcriptional regulator [Patescibacteria group bacterium]|nr:helix-turn-helix transcriptional regulator [Patescibacteria group bacterium]